MPRGFGGAILLAAGLLAGGPAASDVELRLEGQVVDGEGTPLSGTTLALVRRWRGGWVKRAEDREVARTQSGSDGRFRFAVTPGPGSFTLVARRAGLAPLFRDDLRLEGQGTLVLGELRMAAAGSLAGEVESAADGTGVGGASVRVLPLSAWDPAGEGGRGETDAEGRFRIECAPGTWRVEIAADGFAQCHVEPVTVIRPPGAGPRIVAALQPARALGGRVLSRDGKAVAGARIRAQRTGEPSSSGGSTASGGDGSFRLAALEEGYHTLHVDHPDYLPFLEPAVHTGVPDLEVVLVPLGSAHVPVPGAPTGRLPVEVVLFDVGAGDVLVPRGEPRDLWLEDRRLVAGGIAAGMHVLELRVPGFAPARTRPFLVDPGVPASLPELRLLPGATLRGRVVTAQGRPLAARVALPAEHLRGLCSRRSAFEMPDRREVQCAADGSFAISGLAAGPIVLGVRAPAFEERHLAVAETGAGDLGAVTLEPGGAIAGRVVTRLRSPLAGALVEVSRDQRRWSALSDGDGRYTVEGLAPGRYRVTVAAAPGATGDPDAPVLAPPQPRAQVVEVTPGETTRLDVVLE